MSIWSQRILEHPVNGVLSNALTSLRGQQAPAYETSETRMAYDRLLHVLEATEQALQTADAELTHPNPLEHIRSSLNEVVSLVANFGSSRNPVYLQNANAYADQVTLLLAQIPRLVDGRNAARATLSLRQLKTQVDETLTSVRDRSAAVMGMLEALDTKLKSLNEAASQQQLRLDAAIARFEDQFSRAEEARRVAFAEQTEQLSALIKSTVEAGGGAIEEGVRSMHQRVDAEVAKAMQRAELAHHEALQLANEGVKRIKTHLEEAAKIVGVISESGMIHGFQKVANEEQTAAKTWRRNATVAMVVLALFAVGTFVESIFRPVTWGMVSARIFVGLALGLVIAYAARQADRHEAVERQSRRQELELAALDPFLLPLPEADRNAVKKLMAEKMFGRGEETTNSVNPKEFSGSVVDVLKLLAESLQQLTAKR